MATHFFEGIDLTPDLLVQLEKDRTLIDLSPEAWKRVDRARAGLDKMLSESGPDGEQRLIYGANTGFGSFSKTVIPRSDLIELQLNILRSHAVGVGEPLDPTLVRCMILVRFNTFAKGHSGISRATLQRLIRAYNAGVVPVVPCQGSVGASGDLAPLAHVALGLLALDPVPVQLWNGNSYSRMESAIKAAHLLGLDSSPVLEPKDGLALINGTQFISALTSVALVEAKVLLEASTVLAAFSLAVLEGCPDAYRAEIHQARSHPGQIRVAAAIRELVENRIPKRETHANSKGEIQEFLRVQDAYSLRCHPQIAGPAYDAIDHLEGILKIELNSATDNPLVFVSEDDPSSVVILSGGNFHGQYPAYAADSLVFALQSVANVSQQRIFRMQTRSLSGLPSCLAPPEISGLNSGYMMLQYTAAAVTSEMKNRCNPASADTITTCEGQEDHVSMGPISARKALHQVADLRKILGIELLHALEASEYLPKDKPLTGGLLRVRDYARILIPKLGRDENYQPRLHSAQNLLSGLHAIAFSHKE